MKLTVAFLGLLLACMAVAACSSADDEQPITSEDALSAVHRHHGTATAPVTKETLGALIFADTSLSEPRGQACQSCHDPKHGWADPRTTPTSPGAVRGRFGLRNAPGIAYSSLTPPLLPGGDETGYGGGLFWDGRASTLQDQAKGPLMNPLEMNNADAAAVQRKLKAASYASQFTTLYGAGALDDADTALDHLADAIAAFESAIPNRFTSKYDAFLAGHATFTAAEQRGFSLYEDKMTGA